MIQQKLTETKTTIILITRTLAIFPPFYTPARRLRPPNRNINQYIADIRTRSFGGGGAVEFRHQKEQSNIYSVLTLIAQDLVSAPSSQAFCGKIVFGLRNADSRETQSNG